uniref:Zinc knuckle CX2CX4HX4C domain-containing protein n=1 Tax=Chenopodium quinoa TaxID=63459 RepID=A0A803MDR3_CHEQI
MRAKVVVPVDKPLVPGFFYEVSPSKAIWITLRYEGLFIFCHACGRIGHRQPHCKSPQSLAHKEVSYRIRGLCGLHYDLLLARPPVPLYSKKLTSLPDIERFRTSREAIIQTRTSMRMTLALQALSNSSSSGQSGPSNRALKRLASEVPPNEQNVEQSSMKRRRSIEEEKNPVHPEGNAPNQNFPLFKSCHVDPGTPFNPSLAAVSLMSTLNPYPLVDRSLFASSGDLTRPMVASSPSSSKFSISPQSPKKSSPDSSTSIDSFNTTAPSSISSAPMEPGLKPENMDIDSGHESSDFELEYYTHEKRKMLYKRRKGRIFSEEGAGGELKSTRGSSKRCKIGLSKEDDLWEKFEQVEENNNLKVRIQVLKISAKENVMGLDDEITSKEMDVHEFEGTTCPQPSEGK